MIHLLDKELLKDHQHRFMPKRSCTPNLLDFLEKVTSAVVRGKFMDLIFLDFAKAFKKVPRKEAAIKAQSKWSGGECSLMDPKLAQRQKAKSSAQWELVLVTGHALRSPTGLVLGSVLCYRLLTT
jgi:hypothetical protein